MIFGTFLVSYMLSRIHNVTTRNIYNLFFGLLMGFYVYGAGFWVVVFQADISWLLMVSFDRTTAGKLTRYVISLFHLVSCVYFMLFPGETWSPLTPLMINFVKI